MPKGRLNFNLCIGEYKKRRFCVSKCERKTIWMPAKKEMYLEKVLKKTCNMGLHEKNTKDCKAYQIWQHAAGNTGL